MVKRFAASSERCCQARADLKALRLTEGIVPGQCPDKPYDQQIFHEPGDGEDEKGGDGHSGVHQRYHLVRFATLAS